MEFNNYQRYSLDQFKISIHVCVNTLGLEQLDNKQLHKHSFCNYLTIIRMRSIKIWLMHIRHQNTTIFATKGIVLIMSYPQILYLTEEIN